MRVDWAVKVYDYDKSADAAAAAVEIGLEGGRAARRA